jgi:hypothetical protein
VPVDVPPSARALPVGLGDVPHTVPRALIASPPSDVIVAPIVAVGIAILVAVGDVTVGTVGDVDKTIILEAYIGALVILVLIVWFDDGIVSSELLDR